MTYNPHPHPSDPEYALETLESQLEPFSCDDAFPGLVQPSPPVFLTNIDPFPGGEPLGPNPGERPLNSKVPIPRSVYTGNYTASSRVGRACENCRKQKTKCSGHRPTCQRCQDVHIWCSYGDRKREKMLREIKDLTAQVHIYEDLLQELNPHLNSSLAQRVDETRNGKLVRSSSGQAPESFASGTERTENSPVAVAHVEEDFNRDLVSQAIGFVGEHSERAWLYRLKRDLDQDSKTVGESLARPSISSVNYFQDTTIISSLDDVDILVRPPQQIADRLLEDYFQAVHPEFPIIGKEAFMGQYQSFYSNNNVRVGKRWVAVLNLVLAVAARLSEVAQRQPQGNFTDHVAYFARAWRLSMGDIALLNHPSLEQVQVEGLAAFYLLSTGQVNRSWRIIGIAMRSAVTIGLNLRIESDGVTCISQETRYRVWWALFILDTVLCVVAGRPPSTDEGFCATLLPHLRREKDFCEEGVTQLITDQDARKISLTSLLSNNLRTPGPSEATAECSRSTNCGSSNWTDPTTQGMTNAHISNTSLYLLYAVDLASLLREAIETLYAPGTARRSWPEMEAAIFTFNNSTDNWLSHLPAEFHFGALDINQTFIRQRISLGFRFYTTKLVITQPCLRHLARQPPGATSSTVCDTMASMCVQAACQMLDMLPDEADVSWLYGVSPWWCVVHYMMQSTTVLLVELFAQGQRGSTEATILAKKVEKAIRWLRAMSINDSSSRRAWLVCIDILSLHGSKLPSKVNVEI